MHEEEEISSRKTSLSLPWNQFCEDMGQLGIRLISQ